MNLDLLRHVNNQQFDYISGSFAETLAASFLAVFMEEIFLRKMALTQPSLPQWRANERDDEFFSPRSSRDAVINAHVREKCLSSK